MEEQEEEERKEAQFQEELANCRTEEERKTAKRRRKRQREKDAKLRKKNLQAAGIIPKKANSLPEGGTVGDANGDADPEEFTYTPLAQRNEQETGTEDQNKSESKKPSTEEIPNDGSFLEMMKKRMAESENDKDKNDEGPPSKKQAT